MGFITGKRCLPVSRYICKVDDTKIDSFFKTTQRRKMYTRPSMSFASQSSTFERAMLALGLEADLLYLSVGRRDARAGTMKIRSEGDHPAAAESSVKTVAV